MNIYADVDRELNMVPPGINDVETMLLAVSAGIILYPLVRVEGKDAVREFLIKLTATIVYGIERMDAESAAEEAKDTDEEDNNK